MMRIHWFYPVALILFLCLSGCAFGLISLLSIHASAQLLLSAAALLCAVPCALLCARCVTREVDETYLGD